MKLHRFLFTVLLVPGFADPSQAALVFSNLGVTDNGSAGCDTIDIRLASDFLTDGTPTTITGITASLGNSSLFLPLFATFSIFTDNGSGQPGTLVGDFDPLPVLAGANGDFTTTSSGISLLANTPYWVVGRTIPDGFGGTLTWRFNNSEDTSDGSFFTVSGTEVQRSLNAEGFWVDALPGNLRFALDGDIIPILEPIGLALLATAGIFVTSGAFRWWRRRRVALASDSRAGRRREFCTRV